MFCATEDICAEYALTEKQDQNPTKTIPLLDFQMTYLNTLKTDTSAWMLVCKKDI